MNLEKDALALYSRNCLKCSHLVESSNKTYDKCHYSKGNSYCPASELVIVITGKADRYKKRLLKARNSKDAQAEAQVWADVAKESRAFQTRFYDMVIGNI